MTSKKLWVGLIAVVIIAVGFYLVFRPSGSPKSGSVISSTDITATNATEGTFSVGVQTPIIQIGAGTAAGSVQQLVTTGSCVTTSTSTIFSVANPFAATSTVVYGLLTGVGSATTSDILVGTSTAANPAGLTVATSSVDATIFGLFKVASSSPFYAVMGVSRTVGGGTAASSGTYPTSLSRVVVGPGEFLVGFATSTFVHAGADGAIGAGLMATPTACTYKFLWQN